ncbi:MAG TPA: RteC domain-containing protein [Puia sp.]
MKGKKDEAVGYDKLFAAMTAEIEAGDSTAGEDGYVRELVIVGNVIRELRASIPAKFPDEAAERTFFAQIWPRFYGKWFYYLLLHRFTFIRDCISADEIPALIRREDRRASGLFRRHREFWQYYRCRAEPVMQEFTRAYSQGCIFDPLALVLDSQAATLASYKAARCLAYEEYQDFLREQRQLPIALDGQVVEWRETNSAAAELIKAQTEAQSVYIDGKPATAAQNRAIFEATYRMELKSFDKLLYAIDGRKSDDTSYYLAKLGSAMKGRKERLRK